MTDPKVSHQVQLSPSVTYSVLDTGAVFRNGDQMLPGSTNPEINLLEEMHHVLEHVFHDDKEEVEPMTLLQEFDAATKSGDPDAVAGLDTTDALNAEPELTDLMHRGFLCRGYKEDGRLVVYVAHEDSEEELIGFSRESAFDDLTDGSFDRYYKLAAKAAQEWFDYNDPQPELPSAENEYSKWAATQGTLEQGEYVGFLAGFKAGLSAR